MNYQENWLDKAKDCEFVVFKGRGLSCTINQSGVCVQQECPLPERRKEIIRSGL